MNRKNVNQGALICQQITCYENQQEECLRFEPVILMRHMLLFQKTRMILVNSLSLLRLSNKMSIDVLHVSIIFNYYLMNSCQDRNNRCHGPANVYSLPCPQDLVCCYSVLF